MNACVHTLTKPQTSSTRSRGLGRRIHGSVEDTKLSTNKQHSLLSSTIIWLYMSSMYHVCCNVGRKGPIYIIVCVKTLPLMIQSFTSYCWISNKPLARRGFRKCRVLQSTSEPGLNKWGGEEKGRTGARVVRLRSVLHIRDKRTRP